PAKLSLSRSRLTSKPCCASGRIRSARDALAAARYTCGASPTHSLPRPREPQPLEPLDPGPQLDLPRPGAVRLVDEVEIACGDRIRVEQARGLAGRFGAARALDPAVDHDMRNVNALRMKLARHALRQSA